MNSLINIVEKYDKFNNYIKDVAAGDGAEMAMA